MHPPGSPSSVPLRSPEQVMRLERMGASFPTRLSFMCQLIRRMRRERWGLERRRFDLDAKGRGVAVYAAHGPERTYSLVAYMREIDPAQRTDRVIAEVWDATFSLFDGVPGDTDIERLRSCTPRQESGRFRSSELTLARANKSVRLFDHIVDALSTGRQPEAARLAEVGYLMRTTAVYGSGKFGCADRAKIGDRPEMRAPFQAELLTVYLIRWLSLDLVDHVARSKGGRRAVSLDARYARYLGIGNATGLGMAPFLIRYPVLINNWVFARETALARVRALPAASALEVASFQPLLQRARSFVDEWTVADGTQMRRIRVLRDELRKLHSWCANGLERPFPWDAMSRYAERAFSMEGQEFVASLLLEQRGDIVDELAERMSAGPPPRLRPEMTVKDLLRVIDAHYGWALATDYAKPEASKRFWYYSAEKLEPRVGDRKSDPGADLEMPIAIARDVSQVRARLLDHDPFQTVADFLVAWPEYRHIARRVQWIEKHPYGEVRDNLLAADKRPVDILRFKLAFFGVSRFDPKSELWTRVNMFQGAPLPGEIAERPEHEWVFPRRPPCLAGQAAR